jgi:hypothetical protein
MVRKIEVIRRFSSYFRQKSRAGVQGASALSAAVQVKGPDEEKIKQILDRTGYTLDVTTG